MNSIKFFKDAIEKARIDFEEKPERQNIFPYAVTLREVRKTGACFKGYNTAIKAYFGTNISDEEMESGRYVNFKHEEPLQISDIACKAGLYAAFWAMQGIPEAVADCRMFGVWATKRVVHRMKDWRSKEAVMLAQQYAKKEVSSLGLNTGHNLALAAMQETTKDDHAALAALHVSHPHAVVASALAMSSALAAAGQEKIPGDVAGMFLLMCEGHAPWQKRNTEKAPEVQSVNPLNFV